MKKPASPMQRTTKRSTTATPVSFPKKPGNIATGSKKVAKPMPAGNVTKKPKVTKKPGKMTPEDAAMKKILESKYGKIYG